MLHQDGHKTHYGKSLCVLLSVSMKIKIIMKYNISNSMKTLFALMLAFAISSCNYQDIEDAPYPEQMIYMPAAVRGIYDISVVTDTYSVPTPGSPSRFSIDQGSGQVVVPLGVYRSGVNNDGSFTVNISADIDTVNQLINSGTLTGVELLPLDQYTIPPSFQFENGKEIETFDLKIDLNFLESNPGNVYSIAIEISSNERKVNPDYKTTVVLIDTKIVE